MSTNKLGLFWNLSKTVIKPNTKTGDQSISMKEWFENMLVVFGVIPNNSCCSNFVQENSVTTGITAAGTNSQTAATALTTQFNEVGTAAANSGVRLPVADKYMKIFVKNDGANTVKVYPATGATINALSANAAQTIATGKSGFFIATSSTTWKYILVN